MRKIKKIIKLFKGKGWLIVMRKTFKRVAAVALAATMVMGMSISSFAALYTGDSEDSDAAAVDKAWFDGAVVATLATSSEMLPSDEQKKHSWQPDDSHAIMSDSGVGNIKTYVITVPSKADCDEFAAANPTNPTSVRRFQICVYDENTTGGWDPILYGRPDLVGESKYDASGSSISNLSAFIIQDDYLEDEEYKATVYFDMDTYTVAIYKGIDAPTEDNRIGYYILWTSYNQEEGYDTPEALANMNVGEFESKYLTSANAADRIAALETMGITTSDSLPDFVTMLSTLQDTLEDEGNAENIAKNNKKAEEAAASGTVEVETSATEETTTTAATATTAAASAGETTTAANSSVATGDTAPIALFGTLMVAVAAVAVVAKKKEA